MGLPFPLPTGRGGLGGIGGLVILIVVLVVFGRGLFGGDGGFGVTPIDPFPEASAPSSTQGAPDDTFELVRFVSRDVQDFWQEQFQAAGKDYRRSTVVIFTGGTGTGCGAASASTGPFYCPLDQRVYLDLSFFNVLDRRLGAPGDFAQAYVVAHEIAHHVQRLLGIEPEVRRLQEQDPDRANELSVRMELQADCLAGVWGHSTYRRGLLEAGDIEEGLGAASAVGDDRLGAGSRESWTHGSSELRVGWFRKGFDSGDVNSCDTFSGDL
jgi:hypothetical protein